MRCVCVYIPFFSCVHLFVSSLLPEYLNRTVVPVENETFYLDTRWAIVSATKQKKIKQIKNVQNKNQNNNNNNSAEASERKTVKEHVNAMGSITDLMFC